MDLKKVIREVPDFPKPGINYFDITTLLKDSEAFQETIATLCQPYRNVQIDAIAGIESRGFIFGAAMAYELDISFIPIRKPGKLPAETVQESYSLEYGTDAIEIHKDAVGQDMNVLLVDDLLATGGTAAASINLIQKLGGKVLGFSFVIELAFLGGREKLGNVPVRSLVIYDSE